MSLSRHLAGLGARFDRLALRPPEAPPGEAALAQRHAAPWAAAQAWCWSGAGPGHAPLLQPGARPAVQQRLAIAALRGPDEAITTAFAQALARQLDGSTRLEALPDRRAGQRWRLQVKLDDARWWRPRQPGDPWDAGWAVDTPPALRHWKAGFAPRRATLVLADRAATDALRLVLAALVQRQDDLRHAVRWLWVGGDSDIAPQHGLPVQRFSLAPTPEAPAAPSPPGGAASGPAEPVPRRPLGSTGAMRHD